MSDTPVHPQDGSHRSFVRAAVPLTVVLLMATELRLLFQTGLADIDALVYSQLARNVASGIFRLSYENVPFSAAARVGLYGPVAAFYALFGVNDATTFAWTFLCSLAGVGFAYGIGRRVAGEAAGLTSAFLWAILPTGVAASTALMGDGPIAALSMGMVYFLLVAETATGPKLVAALAAGLLCFLVGLASKPAIALLMAFLVVYALWRKPRNLYVWSGLGGLLLLLFAAYAVYTSQISWSMSWLWIKLFPSSTVLVRASTDWWSHVVLGSPEFSWIAPLWIVAIAVLLTLRRRPTYVVLIWFASLFLYLEFGTRSLAFYEPITTASLGTGITRHFLLVAAPATLIGGIYLAHDMRAATARWLVAFAAIVTGVVAWVGMRHATNLDWGITGETLLPFEAKSAIATAIAIFGGIASPLVVIGAPTRWKSAAIAGLCCALGVASLNPSYRAAATYRAVWPQTMTEAVGFFDKNPPLPILVQNGIFGQRLDYQSGFRLGFNAGIRETAKPRVFLAPQDPSVVRDAYIVVDEYYLRTSHAALWGDGPAYLASPPPNFIEVARFGDRDGYRLKVYQVADSLAAKRLDAARAAAKATKTSATLHQWMSAAAGASEYCEAAQAWQQLRVTDAASLTTFDPVPMIRECAAAQPDLRGPNLFQNGDFAKGIEGWSTHPDAQATVSVDADHTWHVQWKGGNWGPIYQEQLLKPDTVYVYEADLKTKGPVVSLYWQSDTGRFAAIEHVYPEWTHERYVFITPHWNGQPMRVEFHPVLMNGKGPSEAWIRNLRISEFRVP